MLHSQDGGGGRGPARRGGSTDCKAGGHQGNKGHAGGLQDLAGRF